jgi:hypothetical protein
VLGSSIIGLEEHTPDNIDQAIDHAVSHGTEFHQFMLYTPIPGTALFAELESKNALKSHVDVSIADIHGQLVFNYRHPYIPDGEETKYLLRAFQRDFETNGPSVVRIVRAVLNAWKKYRDHPDLRIRARFAHEASNLPMRYAGVLWAAKRYYRNDPRCVTQLNALLDELHNLFGWVSRLAAPVVGRYLYHMLRRQESMLQKGWTYEPPTFYEKNRVDGPRNAILIKSVLATSCSNSAPAPGSSIRQATARDDGSVIAPIP